jgi:hypothetical protein
VFLYGTALVFKSFIDDVALSEGSFHIKEVC